MATMTTKVVGVLFLVLFAGVGTQAQLDGVAGILSTLGDLEGDCGDIITRFLLACLSEATEALTFFGIDGLANIADLADIDFESKSFKKDLKELLDADFEASKRCCEGLEAFGDAECGCLEEGRALLELAPEEVINALVGKLTDVCDVKIGLITMPETCPGLAPAPAPAPKKKKKSKKSKKEDP